MQLVKPERRTITVTPIETSPEFTVEMRDLSEGEQNRIYERHGYIPGHEKRGGVGRFAKVLRDVVITSVIRVDGATDGNNQPRDPEADETKLLLLDVEVEDAISGERKLLWQLSRERFDEAKRAQEKNSQTA
jgi:hypothetical protein